MRCSVPVIVTLATYFGERPVEIALYDADEERLELFDMLARIAFAQNKNPQEIASYLNPDEALDGASRVILGLDANCALKEARQANHLPHPDEAIRISETLARIMPGIHNEALVISLLPSDIIINLPYYYRLDWPREPNMDDVRSLPHQVMRWVRGEEYLFQVFEEHAHSPLKLWLDDPATAIIVSET